MSRNLRMGKLFAAGNAVIEGAVRRKGSGRHRSRQRRTALGLQFSVKPAA